MNFQHEGLVSLGLINGMIILGERVGLDFSYPSQKTSIEDQGLKTENTYFPAMNYLAEAVAEVNDYLLPYY